VFTNMWTTVTFNASLEFSAKFELYFLDSEGSRGQDVSRDSDSNSVSGKTGNSKLRPLDSVKPKKLGEAPSGSKHGSK
jgi:hypothetical protein